MSKINPHVPRPRWLRWGAVTAVLLLAAALRFWALGRPGTLVFDELYYVRDAVSQLAHGLPTTWPDNEPVFGGERAQAFSDQAASIAHPPLGKWLIGIGILLFGPDSGLGWRFSVALAGVAAVAATMRLGWLLTRNMWVACVAGLLLAIDGVHVVLSRVALLDGVLTLLIVLSSLLLVRDELQVRDRLSRDPGLRAHAVPLQWRRPWLLAAGAMFGAAAAVKWSGLFAFAAFLIFLTLTDLLRRLRGEPRNAWWRATLQAIVAALIALPVALLTYLASWAGWILNPTVAGREAGESWWADLVNWHTHSLGWHAELDAPHPYQSNPLTWPLALRPTSMYRVQSDGVTSVVAPFPNLLVTWGGVAALVVLVWVVCHAVCRASRRRDFAPLGGMVWVSAFVLVGYLSGWLPWVVTVSRSSVFQFYAVVLTPFAALALALVLGSFTSRPQGDDIFLSRITLDQSAPAIRGRRIAVNMFLGAALLVALFFWPVWSGLAVPEWYYQLHRWLPGWG